MNQAPLLLKVPQRMPPAAGAIPDGFATGTSAMSAAAAATSVVSSGIVLSTLPPAVSAHLARVHHPAWQDSGHLDLSQVKIVKPSPEDCHRFAALPAVQQPTVKAMSHWLSPLCSRQGVAGRGTCFLCRLASVD